MIPRRVTVYHTLPDDNEVATSLISSLAFGGYTVDINVSNPDVSC